LDSLENSHPIEVEVRSSAQIEEIFDAISYHKGASVIRMISNQIGEAAFRKGLNIYLNKFKYSNAVTLDLWAALSEASGYDVRTFMDAYTKTTGYPLVTVEAVPATTNKEVVSTDTFKVSQQRFFSSGKEPTAEESQQSWWISIPVITSKDPKAIHKYDFKFNKEETLKFEHSNESKWVKLNAGQSGFFRVRYATDLSARLTEPIKSLTLGSVDRIGVQNDAFALSVAGYLPLTDVRE
jgi:aminopeptidase N